MSSAQLNTVGKIKKERDLSSLKSHETFIFCGEINLCQIVFKSL